MKRFLLILIVALFHIVGYANTMNVRDVRTLVLYYSYSGVTRTLAEKIAVECDADIIEVVDHGNYPRPESSTTYNYANNERSQIDAGNWPEINTAVDSFDAYDAVIICTPLWNGKMANPMLTFLHNHADKLAGHQVALAVTSWSSGIANVITDANNQLPNSIFVGSALHINYNGRATMDAAAVNWLDTLSFDVPESQETVKMRVIVGDKVFNATLADNATADAFRELLPLTLDMTELNGNEKYNYLSTRLPNAPVNPGTIHAGDIMLYGNSCVVLFYKTFNTSYSYTRIGAIDDPTGLAEALGAGNVTVKFEMSSEALYGDVNGDGEVNIGDVTNLINIILTYNGTTVVEDRIDVNGDGEINISDVTALIAYILIL